jgi:L-gulonate 5-dehydrogenase
MKVVRVLEPNVMQIQDAPSPERHAGEVRVHVERVGICGSDLAAIQGQNPFIKYPLIPGHEFSGRIVETEPGSSLHVNDLVSVRPVLSCGTCRACLAGDQNHCAQLRVLGVHVDGAYAEEITVPEYVIKKVPASIDAEMAAMVEPTAVAVHINRRARMSPGKDIAVIGAGVIGNLILQVGKAKGANKVLAVDRVEKRLPLAEATGADWAINSATVDPIAFTREHVGEGFDIVYDLVGIEPVIEQAIQMTRAGGTVVLIAIPHHKMVSFNYQEVFRKELELIGTRLHNDADFDETIQLLAAGKIDTKSLITHRMPLTQGLEAVELVRTQPDVAFKVILETD